MHRPVERPLRDLTVDAIRDHYDQFAWAYRIFWGSMSITGSIHVGHLRNGSRRSAPCFACYRTSIRSSLKALN
jgi:hypothetical protein